MDAPLGARYRYTHKDLKNERIATGGEGMAEGGARRVRLTTLTTKGG